MKKEAKQIKQTLGVMLIINDCRFQLVTSFEIKYNYCFLQLNKEIKYINKSISTGMKKKGKRGEQSEQTLEVMVACILKNINLITDLSNI